MGVGVKGAGGGCEPRCRNARGGGVGGGGGGGGCGGGSGGNGDGERLLPRRSGEAVTRREDPRDP